MSDPALVEFIEEWNSWAARILEVGVANIGSQTEARVEAWAARADALGWHRDAERARQLLEPDLPLASRARSFLISGARARVASAVEMQEYGHDPAPLHDE